MSSACFDWVTVSFAAFAVLPLAVSAVVDRPELAVTNTADSIIAASVMLFKFFINNSFILFWIKCHVV
jgi:hypothetical protein